MPEPLKPPVLAVAILHFFSTQPDFDAVVGDISEEFHTRAERSGAPAAKIWFWREAFRNAWALTAREVLRTPVPTLMVAFGCFVAVNAVALVYDDFALDHDQRDILLLVQFVTSLALGWMGGKLLPGREWALALMYSLASPWMVPARFGILVHLALHLPPELGPYFFQPVRAFLIWEIVIRIGAFWWGCLWVRRSRPALPAPARNPGERHPNA